MWPIIFAIHFGERLTASLRPLSDWSTPSAAIGGVIWLSEPGRGIPARRFSPITASTDAPGAAETRLWLEETVGSPYQPCKGSGFMHEENADPNYLHSASHSYMDWRPGLFGPVYQDGDSPGWIAKIRCGG
jgi:hypothetical protein